jgi:hypothetical protein
MSILDQIRNSLGKPITISSGYRCAEYNRTIPSSRNTSSHIKGLAVDIKCTSSRQRYELLNIIVPKRECRRIGEADTFLHLDIDESKPQDVWWRYHSDGTKEHV